VTTPEPELDPLDFGDGPPPIDFGHGVHGRWVVDKQGNRIGLLESHPKPDGTGRCFGSVYFRTPEAQVAAPDHYARMALWDLHSLEPLDISPSVLCRTCGHHGFIRNGEWVPA
jgi:hypothetical protein